MLFCVFGAMSSVDWRTISLDNVNFEAEELAQQLVPVLRSLWEIALLEID